MTRASSVVPNGYADELAEYVTAKSRAGGHPDPWDGVPISFAEYLVLRDVCGWVETKRPQALSGDRVPQVQLRGGKRPRSIESAMFWPRRYFARVDEGAQPATVDKWLFYEAASPTIAFVPTHE